MRLNAVYRNAAAEHAVERMKRICTPAAVRSVQGAIKEAALRARSFPCSQVLNADNAGSPMQIEITYNASIGSVFDNATDALPGTTSAVTSADSAREGISQLADSSSRVDSASKPIRAIAEHMNLLVLNATIEAK